MLKQLYAEESKQQNDVLMLDSEDDQDKDSQEDPDAQVKRAFKERLEQRVEFHMSYIGYSLIYILETFCCCLKCCCRKPSHCRRLINSYAKFELA